MLTGNSGRRAADQPRAPTLTARHAPCSGPMTARTLLVAMLQETGHLNPSFKLMRTMQARGHDVRYLATPELTPHIAAQGFPVLPFLPELNGPGEQPGGKLSVLRKRRAITARYRAVAERLLKDGKSAFGLVPKLLLVDVTQTHLSLWARASAIPQVLLNTSLPQTRSPGIAPLRSGLPYSPEGVGKLRNELAWRRFLLKRRLSAQLADLGDMCPPYELSRKLAQRFGVAESELDCETVYMPQLRGPEELVFCSDALDFPRPASAQRHYVESVDLLRKELAFDWQRVPSDKPLVFCALGGQLYRGGQTPAFLRRVVTAFAQRPDLTLVLATGRHMRPEELTPCPPNVLVVERAPQLAMLTRARLMITHGGLGSVKECVMNGVPMLVFPLDVDQPGNAARVAHHGIGLHGQIAHTSVAQLLHMVEQVLGQDSFRERCTALQQKLVLLESGEHGADVLEGVVGRLSRSEGVPCG